MTDENPNQANPPGGDPFAHEPHGEPARTGADNASAKGREWLAQLETMINDVTTQAAPVARQVARQGGRARRPSPRSRRVRSPSGRPT